MIILKFIFSFNMIASAGISNGADTPLNIGNVTIDSIPLAADASTESTLAAFQSINHDDLGLILMSLGAPFQAGGSIGNTAFQCNAGTNLNTSALATSANLSAGTAKVQSVDGSGNIQPSMDAVARAGFMKLTDGTNTAAVKAASTAPASTDPAIVVTLSPNSAVPSTPRTWSYRHVAGAATTVVKSGSGVFHSLCQNSEVGTTTIYDNTAGSGTVIAVLNNAGAPSCPVYDVTFSTGLTVVTTNGANDITALYQ